MKRQPARRGGQLLVDQLVVHGTELAYCVPGESFLDVLDGFHDAPIRLISCRHEAAAANMAEAYGKLTGRPGVCIVTRGPGATHASVGVHTAFQALQTGPNAKDLLVKGGYRPGALAWCPSRGLAR